MNKGSPSKIREERLRESGSFCSAIKSYFSTSCFKGLNYVGSSSNLSAG